MSAVSISDPDKLAITTIRTLCMDAVQQANSGHPGTPMAIGASAPLKHLQTKFGFTPEAVVGLARDRVGRSNAG